MHFLEEKICHQLGQLVEQESFFFIFVLDNSCFQYVESNNY